VTVSATLSATRLTAVYRWTDLQKHYLLFIKPCGYYLAIVCVETIILHTNMVRANTKQSVSSRNYKLRIPSATSPKRVVAYFQLEEKKDTPKKTLLSKKKPVITGVWPCKINGCNKQFAREADLKRHQRTTKLHSMPGLCAIKLYTVIASKS
jgi:hypothetical protein